MGHPSFPARQFAATLKLALSRRTGSLRTGTLLGLALGCLGALLTLSPLAPYLERELGLKWLFLTRGPVRPPEDIVVVGIDRTTGAQLGMPGPDLRDWPRSIHARLTDKLSAAGAKLIVFDLLFEKDRGETDALFAESMRRADNVILARDIERTQLGGGIVREGIAPISPRLEHAALATGAIPLSDAEPRKDSYWSFLESVGGTASLPVVALQAYCLEVYDPLYRLLHALRPEKVAQWPKTQLEARQARAITELPQLLRELVAADPRLRDELQQALGDSTQSGLNDYQRRLLRALLDAVSGKEKQFFNFYGPSWTIERVSYKEALAEEPDRDVAPRFKGKVVFVGFSAADSADNNFARDCHAIVFPDRDGVPICGVELAATAFANLRQGATLSTAPNTGVFFLLLTLGIALGIVGLASSAAVSAATILALALAYWGYAYHEFAVSSRWLPVVMPSALLPAAALLASAWIRYGRAENQRKRLRNALTRFVPERVADALIETVPEVVSYRQLVFGACLATDAQEYSSVSEILHPSELANLVQDYSRVLFSTVQQHGGMVCGEAGDSMIGIWAGPSESAALRAKACTAVLDILARVDEFNRTSGRPSLPTRFGLHAGEFVLGIVGTEQHLDFRAVGDIVNTASRIEGLNKDLGTRCLVSSTAVEGLDDFLTRPLGSFSVKGRTQPVSVGELIAKRADAPSDRVLLCDLFALALKRYEEQRWRECEDAFRLVLREFPDDGPSKYYLDQCAIKKRSA